MLPFAFRCSCTANAVDGFNINKAAEFPTNSRRTSGGRICCHRKLKLIHNILYSTHTKRTLERTLHLSEEYGSRVHVGRIFVLCCALCKLCCEMCHILNDADERMSGKWSFACHSMIETGKGGEEIFEILHSRIFYSNNSFYYYF